jgi:hypothetical protein
VLLSSLAVLLLAGSSRSAPPEVVHVHVPASGVATWFPAGTPLRILPPEQFDALLGAAARASARGGEAALPRLIRARHHARLEAGVLVGSSRLVVMTSASGQGILTLDSWTPVILPTTRRQAIAGALQSGKTALWLEPADAPGTQRDLTIDWELCARPDSGGRSFALGLPGDESSELSLELPAGWVPVGPAGYRQGPLPTVGGDLVTWRFHGWPGQGNLQLLDSRAPQSSSGESLLWVSGPTQITLDSIVGRNPGSVNWETDWKVMPDRLGRLQFSAELDPGLELIDVTGPDVREYESQHQGEATRVRVILTGCAGRETLVRFRAHARIPLEGHWSIPAIRPLDAIWTGGTTTVIVDSLRAIEDCRQRAGWRVPAQGVDLAASNTLVFEATAPASVAELVFRQPRDQTVCRVRGRLSVGRSVPAFECQINGVGEVASATELDVDLPPTWVPDRVSWAGADESLAWHLSVLANGETRLRVLLPGREKTQESRPLVIGATSTARDVLGPLVLPRIRPAGVPVADEVWVAMVDRTMNLIPTAARGLVWIDPYRVEGFAGPAPLRASDPRPALAWRWNAEAGSARLERELIEQAPRAEIQYRAQVEQDGLHLALEGQISLFRGTRPLSQLPVWESESRSGLEAWSFRWEGQDQEIPRTALDERQRSLSAFPETGLTWNLDLAGAKADQTRIQFRARLPWTGGGTIPLVFVPKQYLPRSTVLIEVPRHLQARIRAVGLRRLEAALSDRLAASWEQEKATSLATPRFRSPRSSLIADGFIYTEAAGTLGLFTEELKQKASGGVVREAYLTTLLHPHGHWPNRLRLLVHADEPRELALSLPPGASLVRVERDGLEVVPLREGDRILVALTPSAVGDRYQTIDLDFETAGQPMRSGMLLRPVLPHFDIPCLSFCWELLSPPGWQASTHGSGLLPADFEAEPVWPSGSLGIPTLRWPSRKPNSRVLSQETLRRLDDVLSPISGEELTFAEWFARWDIPTHPLFIDRLALNAAGYGPRSRCVPVRTDPKRQSLAVLSLKQYALAMVPLDSGLLITSGAEASKFDSPESFLPAIAQTMLWGRDRSDRFQTVQRWRGETTPKDALAGKASVPPRSLPGLSVWHFTCVSWPEPAAQVELRDGRTGLALGWASALFVLLLSTVLRLPARWRILVPTALAALALVLHLLLPDKLSAPTAGLLVGALGSLFYRLGFQLTRRGPGESSAPARWTPRLLAQLSLRAAPIVLAAILAGRSSALARRVGEDPPIQVLIPYEGTYQPGQPADRVVVRQSDCQMLEKLADLRSTTSGAEVVLVGASHHLSWSGQREALLESELELRATGEATWKLPVGGAREISAVLDGRVVPVFIEAGGQQATIALPAAGSFKLLARRTVDATGDEPGVTLDFPVNPHPGARLVVDRPDRFGALKLSTARGRIETANERLTAGPSPADHTLLRWGENDAAAQAAGIVMDGTLLWDLLPAGDLLRARFTCRTTTRRLSSLSFQIDKGLIPRSVRVPGLIASTIEGTDKHRVWTLRFDPPLQDKSELQIEMWRPAENELDGRNGPLTRRLPRLEPLGVEKYAGLLGVRRPAHWSGRLGPIEGTDTLSDQSFVKLWGPLPDDRLTLAGTTRLVRDITPIIQTGPALARVKVRPNLELRTEPGRIDVSLDVAFDDDPGSLDHLELAVPPDLVVLSVKSEGLTHWSRSAPRRLLLRYDRAFPQSRRRLSIRGWIPVPQDPLALGTQPLSMPTPWLELLGMDNQPGKLIIDSEVALEIKDATGLFALPKANAPAPLPLAAEAGRESRVIYRVDDPSHLGNLSWTSLSPTANVTIESQMRIHRDAAQWVAVLRYDVLGGARQSIHLKLPIAWAQNAQVDLAGTDFHYRAASVGSHMFWTITPDHPVWGTQRVVIRSVVPHLGDQEVAHPEIAPLGQGHIDTYLGLVYADRRALSVAGTNGLHELSPASHFSDPEFSHEPGTEARAFHVDSDRWWLKVQASAPAVDTATSSDESARVVSADLNLVLLPDRSLLGQAVYETQAQTGRFLVVELPEESSVIWLTVDGNPVLPLRSKSGRFFVPLAEPGAGRVNLFWKKPASSAPAAQWPWSCTLPKAGVGSCSTLLTLHLPPNMTARSAFAGLELTAPDRVELERADRIAQQLTDFAARIDRSSGRDRQRALALLISHETALRDVERSLQWNARRDDRGRGEQAGRDLEIIAASRKTLQENLRAAALDDEIEAAEAYFGAAPKVAPASAVAVPDPASPDRLRNIGRPSFLIGMSSGLDEPPSRILGVLAEESGAESETVADVSDQERPRALLLLGFLGAILLTVGVRIPRPATTFLICAGLLGFLTFLGGPVLTSAGFVLCAMGYAARVARRNDA